MANGFQERYHKETKSLERVTLTNLYWEQLQEQDAAGKVKERIDDYLESL